MIPRPLSLLLSAALLASALCACATPPRSTVGTGFGSFCVGEGPPASTVPSAYDSRGESPASSSHRGGTGQIGDDTGTTSSPEDPPPPTTIEEAVRQGTTYLKLRVRGESVKQSGFKKDANAITVRTVLGFETAPIHGFSVLIEAENVSDLNGDPYNDTINGKTDRPVIADPSGTEVNQAYLQYKIDDTVVRGGRQRITLDNHRFIGNVGWRQNEQTFDAVSAKGKIGAVEVFTSWISNVNRIFGEDSPVGDARMDSYLFHAKAPVLERSSVTGYWYYLDYNNSSGMTALSTSTLGGRFDGSFGGDEDSSLVDLLVEFARQEDTGSNDTRVRADYSHVKVTGNAGPVTLAAGRETLDGSQSGNGAFNTPLATLHAMNGWADKFLSTPGTGLQDSYVSVGGKVVGTKLLAVFHDFRSEASSANYGQELNVLATRPINEHSSWGAKYADYNAKDFSTNTRKYWLWYETRF